MEDNKKDITSEKNNSSDTVVFAEKNNNQSAAAKTDNTEGNTITFNSLNKNSKTDTSSVSAQSSATLPNKDIANDNTITFSSVNKNSAPNIPAAPKQNNADDGIVFAYSEKPSTKPSTTQKKNKIPTVALISGSVAIVCIAVVAVLLTINANQTPNTTVPAVTSQSSIGSEDLSSSTSSDNSSESSDVIKETSFEIKEVDTTNILFSEGVTVEGVNLTGMTLSDAYDAMEDTLKEIRDTITITIKCDGKSITLTEDDFEFDTNISDVLIQAYHYSRNELVSPTVETVESNGVTDFNITSVINNDSIENAVKKVAEKFDIQPVEAHVSNFDPNAVEKFTYASPSNGYLIDQDELKKKITNILSQSVKTSSFSIETVETPYTISLDDIKANTKLIASHSTKAVNSYASVHNMKLALKSANGVEVKPGETFSFNETTGDTTTGALGYLESTAIVNGKYVDQYGGGICQASTTIYICALKADMEVVERYAHQYPSSYAERGLDATVDYGNLDMKFKNTGKYSIFIATYSYDYDGDGYEELMVEMYGSPSTEYDEIVPVGWISSVGSSRYSAKGAKVYFKDGKEIDREYLPVGSYSYQNESKNYISSLMPSDVSYGPKNVSPTYKTPTVYSPGGCGSSSPIPYGTAGDVQENTDEESSQSSQSSNSSHTSQSSQVSQSSHTSQSSQVSQSSHTSQSSQVSQSSHTSQTSQTHQASSSTPVSSSEVAQDSSTPVSSDTSEEMLEETTQPSEE